MKTKQGVKRIIAKSVLFLFCLGAFLFAANIVRADSFEDQNALRMAKKYLEIKAFSHDKLIEQLEYEHFSHEAATYAADHCGANWTRQAEQAAKDYLSLMPFSREGLIEQLVYDGYTREQAESGARAVGY